MNETPFENEDYMIADKPTRELQDERVPQADEKNSATYEPDAEWEARFDGSANNA